MPTGDPRDNYRPNPHKSTEFYGDWRNSYLYPVSKPYYEELSTSPTINININLSLQDLYQLMQSYVNDGIQYVRDDAISIKIRETLNEWLNGSNPKLPEVSATPSSTNPPLTYSGHENREFQVW